MTIRKQLTIEDFNSALDEVSEKLQYRQLQKGMGAYASSHEVLGIIQDELVEFRDEVHAKSFVEPKVQELIDIAVGALWGIASYRNGEMDW